MTALSKFNFSAEEAAGNFPWEMYEGNNGVSLKPNKKVKHSSSNKDKVYSHEAYAQEMYNRLSGMPAPVSKEIRKDSLVSISDLVPLENGTVMATVNNGANNIVIDLAKETKFLNALAFNGATMDKETFLAGLKNPEIKNALLGMNLNAKVGTDVAKASIWDGYVETISNEMKQQIVSNNKAYVATVVSTNKGGFVVDIMNIIKAFMPGSMAASNRVTDYESLIGQSMEVMVESWDPRTGFVVSRKKFLRTMLPIKLNQMAEVLKQNQDTVFTGRITGATAFGVFIELDEFITGMLHKSLVSDELRNAMREGTIEVGSEINVYVHRIENKRVVLSDVPSSERDEVIARREEEDAKEKVQHRENKAREEKVEAETKTEAKTEAKVDAPTEDAAKSKTEED